MNMRSTDMKLTAAIQTTTRFRYQMLDGTKILAARPADIISSLREKGWKNISRLDGDDFIRLGFKVVTARYASGVKPGRPCEVVILEEG